MAIEPYRSRAQPQVTLSGGVNPRAFTGILPAIGEAAESGARAIEQHQQAQEQIAQIDHRTATIEREQADTALSVKKSVEWAEYSQRMETRAKELATAPGGRETLETELKAGANTFLNGFDGNVEVEQRFAPNVALFNARLIGAADERAIVVKAKATADGADAAADAFINRALSDPGDATIAAEAARNIDTLYDGMTGIDPALIPALKRAKHAQLYTGMTRELARRGEIAKARALLDSDILKTSLEPTALSALRGVVDTEENAVRIAADHAEAEHKAALREEVSTLRTLVTAGADVPESRLDDAARVATGLGETGDAAELLVLRQQVAVNRQYRGKSAAERAAAISGLDAKAVAGKASAAEQIALKQLRALDTAMTSEEAKPLRTEYQKGASGRAAVADSLQSLPPAARFAKAEAVDKGFGAVAMLPDALRAVAIQGEDDLPAVAKHFEKGADRTAFNAAMGRAGDEFQGSAMEGVFSAAKAIYAFRARRAGLATFDQKLFTNSVNEALGAQRVNGVWHGGIGTWNNGRIILPDSYSQPMFDTMIGKTDFSLARMAGDKPLTKAQILAYYRPVYVGESDDGQFAHYQWRDRDGGLLGRKGGGAYLMRVHN